MDLQDIEHPMWAILAYGALLVFIVLVAFCVFKTAALADEELGLK